MCNLMFCVNNKVMDGLIISLLSIAKHTNEVLNVYVVTMDLTNINENYAPISKEQIEVLDKIVKSKNPESKVELVDATKLYIDEFLKAVNKHTHYTPYIFLRLLSDKMKELPDKILYLDCDIVCYKDIKEIFDIDIENYEIGVATDYIGRNVISKKYINSGVLLLNLKKIKETGSFEKARNIVKKVPMLMPDQTALYRACKEKLLLPDKCNEQKERKDDTIIRHFSMQVRIFPYFRFVKIKPWNIDRVHNEYKIFDYEDILKEYLKIKDEMKQDIKKEKIHK